MNTFQTSKRMDEESQKASLRRMRTISTLLFLLMVVIFIVSSFFEKNSPYLGFLRAFAEAGMVGALADWFAVVALFRHPLGLPIPHTAIIQRNKDKFGKSLANFIKNNFLVRETLEEKLQHMDVAAWIADALSDPRRVRMITTKVVENVQSVAAQFDDHEMKRIFSNLAQESLRQIKLLPLVGDILTMMMEEDKHQDLLSEILTIANAAITQNKDTIREKTRHDHPWWMPEFVDEMIFNKMVSKAEETLTNIHDNRDHDVRKRLDKAATDLIHDLKHSDAFMERVNIMGKDFLANPVVRKQFENLWSDIKVKLLDDLKAPESELRRHVESGILTLGRGLKENPSLKEGINRWIYTSLVNLAEEYVDVIISIISDTVKQWDADKTSRTIELYVGKDLQWIRINGTIVGGLVGLLIYGVSLLFR